MVQKEEPDHFFLLPYLFFSCLSHYPQLYCRWRNLGAVTRYCPVHPKVVVQTTVMTNLSGSDLFRMSIQQLPLAPLNRSTARSDAAQSWNLVVSATMFMYRTESLLEAKSWVVDMPLFGQKMATRYVAKIHADYGYGDSTHFILKSSSIFKTIGRLQAPLSTVSGSADLTKSHLRILSKTETWYSLAWISVEVLKKFTGVSRWKLKSTGQWQHPN